MNGKVMILLQASIALPAITLTVAPLVAAEQAAQSPAMVQKITIGAQRMLGDPSNWDLAGRATAYLSDTDSEWAHQKCKVTAILQQPTHGALTQKPDGRFSYLPTKLGKDVVVFMVESETGKKAIVTLKIEVIPLES